MISKKTFISLGILIAAVAIASILPMTAMAQLISPSDQPSSLAQQTGGQGDLKEFIKTIINYLLYFLGFIAVCFIIYAGFLYVTAGVSEDNVAKAKKIITEAIIGILIIMASFAIVNTVLKASTGTTTQVTTQQ